MSDKTQSMRLTASMYGMLVLLLFVSSCDLFGTASEGGGPETDDPPRVSWEASENASLDVNGVVKRPSLVVDGSKRYVAFQVDNTDSVPQDVYVVRKTGDTWSRPVQVSEGDAPSSRPVLERGPDGTLHLVWGERLRDVSPRPDGSPHAAFYASSTDGGRTWSTPTKIFDSRTDRFFGVPRSIEVDSDGHVHVVLSSKEREDRPASIKHLERTADGWTGGRTSIGGRAGGLFPDMALREDGTILVSYIRADTTENRDKNTIFLATSSDNGETWTDGTTVGNENFSGARWTRIETSGRRAHVIWLDDEDGGPGAEIIGANHSTDGGQTWNEPKHVATLDRGAFDPPEFVVADDVVHVAANRQGLDIEQKSTRYLNWSPRSGWSSMQTPFQIDITSSHPGMALGPQGDVHVALAGKDTDGDLGKQDGLFYTTGTVQ